MKVFKRTEKSSSSVATKPFRFNKEHFAHFPKLSSFDASLKKAFLNLKTTKVLKI